VNFLPPHGIDIIDSDDIWTPMGNGSYQGGTSVAAFNGTIDVAVKGSSSGARFGSL